MELMLLLLSVVLTSVIGFYIFFYLAKQFQIQAVPNYRSLHTNVVPRGGGIVVAISVLLGVSGLYFQHYISTRSFATLLLGGLIGTTIGFIDDVIEVKALFKFFVQIGLALIILVSAKLYPDFSQPTYLIFAKLLCLAWFVFCIVWFFNSFNFIDGSDGMAIMSVVYISSIMGIVLLFKHEHTESIYFLILLLSSLVFLYFNWPPAKVFLGDAGSFFLSYYLCFLLIDTVSKGLVSIWFWLILFAYYFSDTILTNLVRFLTVPHWYRPHRSHAYQNMARNRGHLKVLTMVLMVNLFWLLPLALLTLAFPRYEYVIVLLAYAPICIFILKHGPLYEDK